MEFIVNILKMIGLNMQAAEAPPENDAAKNPMSIFNNMMKKLLGLGGDNQKAEAAEPTKPQAVIKSITEEPRKTIDKAQITDDKSKPNSAILNEKGELVAGNNPYEKVDPTSTVKTMTYYTVLDKIKKEELPKDFVQKNNELFKKMLSNSDNGAAGEIAELAGKEIIKKRREQKVPGYLEEKDGTKVFLSDMNKLAKDKCMTNTHFTNACGLPEQGMFSTAADMAKWSYLIVKDFPKEALEYTATAKVSTAAKLGINGENCTFKTGTGGGSYCKTSGNMTVRAGAGAIDSDKDGKYGAFAIAESSKDSYVSNVKDVIKLAKSMENVDISPAGSQKPSETPAGNSPPKQLAAKVK